MKQFALEAFDPPLALPLLDCGPVVVRPFGEEDVAMVMEAARDPYIPSISAISPECSRGDAEAFIARQRELADEGHAYSLVIASGEQGSRGLGSIALWLRDIRSGRGAMGYWVTATSRGAGVAGWALRGLVAFAFDELAIPRLQLFIEPWNSASVVTAEFAGFTRESKLRAWERIGHEQRDADCYALLRHEWEPS